MSVPKKIKDTIDEIEYRYGIPKYNYLTNIKTPRDKGIGSSGSKLVHNAFQLPYWIKVLLLGDGGNDTRSYPKGKGIYNTGGALGNKYKISTGFCPNDTLRWTTINNITSGKVRIGDKSFNTPFKGIVPGLLEDLYDIRPEVIIDAVQGKGINFGECFINKNNNIRKINFQYIKDILYIILFLILLLLFNNL